MISILQLTGGIIFLAFAVFCYLRPNKCKWMPVYKISEKVGGEKFGLLMVRISTVSGGLLLAAILFGFSFGLIEAL